MTRSKNRIELEVGGEVRPLLFDFSFLDLLSESEHYAQLDDIAGSKPWRLIPIIALYAIRAGAEFEGKKEKKPVTLSVVSGWVQELDALDAKQIVDCYKSAMGFMTTALGGNAPAGAIESKK